MKMENLTLETLPKAFEKLVLDVDEIKKLLAERKSEVMEDSDKWFDLNGLCLYLPDKPSKYTVYGWVKIGLIPVHKGGKKLRFLKSEIDDWLRQGRKKTMKEIEVEAENYLKSRKRV